MKPNAHWHFSLTIILTTAGVACDPLGENAGEVEATDSEGSDPSTGTTGATADGTETDGEPPQADVDWSLEIEPGRSIIRMLRTPAGILVSLQGDPTDPMPDAEVREYSSNMELLWSVSLPNAGINDLEDLGGGEFLAVGVSGESGTFVPTAWRLSCCAEPVSQSYVQDPAAGTSWISGAELRGDGILLVIQHDTSADLVQVPLALSPVTPVDVLSSVVYDAARTPDGTVLLRAEAGDVDMFFEVGPEGIEGGFGFGDFTGMVGKGDELTLMRFGENEVEIQLFGEDAWVQVPIPGFVAYFDEFALGRHDRVVLAHREDEPGSALIVTEFADDGVVARTLTLLPMQYDEISTHGLVVGEDDAIYLTVDEYDLEAGRASFLKRIAPLVE